MPGTKPAQRTGDPESGILSSPGAASAPRPIIPKRCGGRRGLSAHGYVELSNSTGQGRLAAATAWPSRIETRNGRPQPKLAAHKCMCVSYHSGWPTFKPPFLPAGRASESGSQHGPRSTVLFDCECIPFAQPVLTRSQRKPEQIATHWRCRIGRLFPPYLNCLPIAMRLIVAGGTADTIKQG